MDTQISLNAPHSGYLWVTYRRTFHGAPITLDSMDDHPFHAAYVAHEVDARYGKPSIYATLEEGHPTFMYLLQAEQHARYAEEEPPVDLYYETYQSNAPLDNLLLFSEHMQLDSTVNQALEAVEDMGVKADIM